MFYSGSVTSQSVGNCNCSLGFRDVNDVWPYYAPCINDCRRIPPTMSPYEYAFWYYPVNQRPPDSTTRNEANFLTGYYGMAFDPSVIPYSMRFGLISEQMLIKTAKNANNAVISNLLKATLTFDAIMTSDNVVTANSMTGFGKSPTDIFQTRDGGKFMNQLDVPNVGYTNASVLGYLRIASAPRHFVFTHAISNSSKSVRITIGGSAINELTNVTWLIPDYAVRMTN